MKKWHVHTVTLAAAVLLVACDGALIEGEWESGTGACENSVKDRLTVDSDLTGSGDFVMACTPGAQDALVCASHVIIIETPREDLWTLEVQFGYCPATEQDYGRRFKDCMAPTEDVLTCCDPDGQHCRDYLRVGD